LKYGDVAGVRRQIKVYGLMKGYGFWRLIKKEIVMETDERRRTMADEERLIIKAVERS
jgi:hypothetical protein